MNNDTYFFFNGEPIFFSTKSDRLFLFSNNFCKNVFSIFKINQMKISQIFHKSNIILGYKVKKILSQFIYHIINLIHDKHVGIQN